MTTKNEFPTNTGLRARMNAVLRFNCAAFNVLEMVKTYALEKLPDEMRQILERQVDDALAKGKLAMQAVAGDDEI